MMTMDVMQSTYSTKLTCSCLLEHICYIIVYIKWTFAYG